MTPSQISDLNTMLPRGMWYDVEKQKFRVRLYRNRRPLHGGYHSDIEAAIHALVELENLREQIPGRRSSRSTPATLNFGDVCSNLFSNQRTRTVVLNVRDT